MARPAPADDEIVKALELHHRTGFPMKESDAAEIVRIHFGTTTKKASEWLTDLAAREEPALYEVWTRGGGFSSVIRRNTGQKYSQQHPEAQLVRVNLPDLGLNVDEVCVDHDGRFTDGQRPSPSHISSAWLMPPSMLTGLVARQRSANHTRRIQREQERDAEAQAFEERHPRVLERIRAALTGVVADPEDAIRTSVYELSTGSVVTTLTITLRNEEIGAGVKLLTNDSETPSTQE